MKYLNTTLQPLQGNNYSFLCNQGIKCTFNSSQIKERSQSRFFMRDAFTHEVHIKTLERDEVFPLRILSLTEIPYEVLQSYETSQELENLLENL